jgi:hypothetical protein
MERQAEGIDEITARERLDQPRPDLEPLALCSISPLRAGIKNHDDPIQPGPALKQLLGKCIPTRRRHPGIQNPVIGAVQLPGDSKHLFNGDPTISLPDLEPKRMQERPPNFDAMPDCTSPAKPCAGQAPEGLQRARAQHLRAGRN